MKSLRLTKQLRENILASFIAKYKAANTEPSQPKSDRELGNDLAEKLHQKIYGKYVDQVPQELFNLRHYINVKMPNGSVAHLYYPRDSKGSDYRISTRENKVEYVLTNEDPLYQEYLSSLEEKKKQNNEFQDYHKNLGKFVDDVSQVLESVNTTKQLVEVWPESEPFLPTEVSNPSSINLPAVNFAEINKVIK